MLPQDPHEDTARDFLWSASDVAELNECSLFLAADVVYGDDISHAFVSQVVLVTTLPPSEGGAALSSHGGRMT